MYIVHLLLSGLLLLKLFKMWVQIVSIKVNLRFCPCLSLILTFTCNPSDYYESFWEERYPHQRTKCVSNMWCDNVMSTVCLHFIKLYETILTIFSVGLIHWKWDTSHWATAAKIYWANKSFLFETWINFM